MLVSSAFAQTAGSSASGGGFDMFIILIPIILIMYFLIIRPQRQQMKKRQTMLNSVNRGDTVVTGGGVVGKIIKVYEELGELEVEIAEGTKIRVLRSTLQDVRRKEVVEKKAATVAKPTVKAVDNKKLAKKNEVASADARVTKKAKADEQK